MAKLNNVFSKEELKKTDNHKKRVTKWIHYSKLRSNKYQIYDARDKEEIEALADMIEAEGEVLQDIGVRKIDTDEYEIILGHKRTAACKLLVEERGKEEFAFLPCRVSDLNDIRTEFRLHSSNMHHEETPYETMCKLVRMGELLKTHPEEFPEVPQTGRIVERLARLYNMKKTTVGEYQKIAKNLSPQAMQTFKDGSIDKSAAVTLAGMTHEEQDKALDQGYMKDKDIRKYKEEQVEPTEEDVRKIYDIFRIQEFDEPDRKTVVAKLILKYGKSRSGGAWNQLHYDCTPNNITLNGRKASWARFVHLLNAYKPYVFPSEVSLYVDTEGNKYKVMGSIGQDTFKARVQKPQYTSSDEHWHGVKSFPWRSDFWSAQDDLDRMARSRGWKKVSGFLEKTPEPVENSTCIGKENQEDQLPGQMEIVNTQMDTEEISADISEDVAEETESAKNTDNIKSLEREMNLKEKTAENLLIEVSDKNFVRASFVYGGQSFVIFLMAYQKSDHWCFYIPERKAGGELSLTGVGMNALKLSCYIEDKDELRALSTAVWEAAKSCKIAA